MIKQLWHKMTKHRKGNPHQSLRAASRDISIPKSTIHDHDKRLENRRQGNSESDFLESEVGQDFIKRMLVSSIYTFAIKGGVGAGRIEEFLGQMRVGNYMGISRTSIHRMIKEIEGSILLYRELREKELKSATVDQKEYLEVVLGLDETWLSDMLLVCQELSSGYLEPRALLSSQAQSETAQVGKQPSKKM